MKIFVTFVILLFSSSIFAEPLRIGVDPNLKPFVYQDSEGTIKGFDVDVAKEICEEIDRECQFVSMDWDGLIPSLKSSKIDAIISSMTITEERAQVVNFSRPYYKSPSQLMVKEGFTGLAPGDSVGVLRGSTDEVYANDTMKPLGINVLMYSNQNEAFLDLVSGRTKGVLGPKIELQAGLLDTPHGKGYTLTGPLLDDPKYFGPGIGIATNKNDPALTNSIDQAIVSIRQSGKWQEISDSYFDFDIWPHSYK